MSERPFVPNGAALFAARSTVWPWRKLASTSPRYDGRVRITAKTVATPTAKYDRATGNTRGWGTSMTVVMLAYRKAGEPWTWTAACDFCAPEKPFAEVEAVAAQYADKDASHV